MMYPIIKRGLDSVSSVALLLVLLPLLIIIVIVLKLTGEGEVFYLQKRVGKNGKPFGMIKFATMLKDSENMKMGTTTTVNDPRVTNFGSFLRKTKINELPQIINVLNGDISVVGPRPLPANEYNLYSNEIKESISKIKPGITGIGSLIFRDEEGIINKNGESDPLEFYNQIILPYKGQLEKWYTNNLSFGIDLKILVLTFVAILKPDLNLTGKYFHNLPQKPKNLDIT